MSHNMTDWIDDYTDATGAKLYLMEPRDVFDAAIVGIAADKVIYDRHLTLALLMEMSDMSYDDAMEYHYMNQDAVSLWYFLDRPAGPFDPECMGGTSLDDLEASVDESFHTVIEQGIQALEDLENGAAWTDTFLN
jgi:hypothetical protein